MKRPKTAISPTREENYSEWYQALAQELADHSPVRGCMVMKPWGYAIWEQMQRVLDKRFKETGHQNCYFPLLLPLSFLEKEAAHVDGFAKECAVVTHHRLEKGEEGKLVPAGELEEPLVIRPTSETMVGEMFSRWITSYRDLPLLINQWANVVRWEMRTRMFLRTTEFLWQEGHTAHASAEEALEETMRMLHLYEDFIQRTLSIPVIKGEKTAAERFPGAVSTYTLEAMMQDRKALQMATSHFLGQNFAKASNILFRDASGENGFVWTTSWGSTTRMIGALIMTHGDDDGLVLPPKIAGAHVVIIPVIHEEEHRAEILRYCQGLTQELRHLLYDGVPLRVVLDERDMKGGDKFWSWVRKGIPIRIEVGLRDITNDSLPVNRRDKGAREALLYSRGYLVARIAEILEDIQSTLYQKALQRQTGSVRRIESKKDLYDYFGSDSLGGFALVHLSEDPGAVASIQEELGVTVRCIPLSGEQERGECVITGKESRQRVLCAKAY